MPELPEVETVARELNKKLKGRVIASVSVRAHKLVSVGPATLSPKRKPALEQVDAFAALLVGKKIISVERRAKVLMFRLTGNYILLVHLKMTGQFIFEDKELHKKTGGKYRLLNKKTAPLTTLPHKHTHVIFSFKDKTVLYFNDVRKFAYLKLVTTQELGAVKEFEQFGPEPFDKAFTLAVFTADLKRCQRITIKQALLDPKLVAGIGNIYSDEILFHAKVRPVRKVASLSPEEIRDIFNNIVPVLKKGIAAKGSSVGDFVRTDGTWGVMGKFHYVYGRKNQLCKICGNIIESVTLGGRTSSYCPVCQK